MCVFWRISIFSAFVGLGVAYTRGGVGWGGMNNTLHFRLYRKLKTPLIYPATARNCTWMKKSFARITAIEKKRNGHLLTCTRPLHVFIAVLGSICFFLFLPDFDSHFSKTALLLTWWRPCLWHSCCWNGELRWRQGRIRCWNKSWGRRGGWTASRTPPPKLEPTLFGPSTPQHGYLTVPEERGNKKEKKKLKRTNPNPNPNLQVYKMKNKTASTVGFDAKDYTLGVFFFKIEPG